MKANAQVWVQHLIPQRLCSLFIYHLARCRWPWIKGPLISWFAAHYRVDLSETETGDLSSYATFNEFFTRALRPGARPLAGDERTAVSPVDGTLSAYGEFDGGTLLQAKGMPYSLAELTGERFAPGAAQSGHYATFYLAPHNYHRVHLPLAGVLKQTRYLPGHRYSVSPATARAVGHLFARNERVVCWFDTACGPMGIVLVGALNVSSITTRWLGEIASGKPRTWPPPAAPEHYARGAQIGHFNLGSTVIVLLPARTLVWDRALVTGLPVRVGDRLGALALLPPPGNAP